MAVRHGYGKIAGTDALVFAYDTGDTVNSYKGEPTTNYTTDSGILQNGWSGGFSLLDSSTKSFQLNVSNFHTDNRGWRSFMWDMRAHAGSAVTISATVEVPSDSPGDFAWVMIGQANTRDSGTTTATYLGYSSASERYQKSTSNTERITWSGIVGNTGTANQPNGIIGFTMWYNGGTIGTNSFIKVSNVQIELKSHATQFVNGTRSVSGSLFDLTGNSSVDLSNVSFDSNADINLDGTDDYIETADSSLLDLTTDMSFEFVVNADSSQGNLYPRLIDKSIYLIHITQTSPFTIAQNITTSGGLRQTALGSAFTAGEYTHIVTTYDGRYGQIFVNGDLKYTRDFSTELACNTNSTSVRIGGDGSINRPLNGQLPISKIYNRVLSAAEVQSNYRHYKNRFGI